MSISQLALARLYIADAVKNSSASIRACWTIVFTAATIGALTPLTVALRCAFNDDKDVALKINGSFTERSCDGFQIWSLVIIVWIFTIYFMTFVRFYLGGIRLFDIKYNEILSLVSCEITLSSAAVKEKPEDLETKSRLNDALDRFERILRYKDKDLRYKIEVFWLLFQSLIVVSLAYAINTPRFFVITFGALIAANAVYLEWSIRNSKLAITTIEHEVFPEWVAKETDDEETKRILTAENLPNYAARQWVANNAIHSSLLFSCLLLSLKYDLSGGLSPLMVICLSLCTSNCLCDFLITKNFYFPPFSGKYRILKLIYG